MARLTATAKKFDEKMKDDHFILSTTASKRLKTGPLLTLADWPKPPTPTIELKPFPVSELKADEWLGMWKITPTLSAFIMNDGRIGLSTSQQTQISPLSVVLAKFGKGPFEWADKLKDLSGTIPYVITADSMCREVKKKGAPGPVVPIAELYAKTDADHPGVALKYYDKEIKDGKLHLSAKRTLVLQPEEIEPEKDTIHVAYSNSANLIAHMLARTAVTELPPTVITVWHLKHEEATQCLPQ